MAGGEPPLKKAKVNCDDDVFLLFHKERLDILEKALSLMKHESSGYAVGVANIKICNAQTSKRFSNATCVCEELCTPGATNEPKSKSVPIGYDLRGIFQYGYDILESYIESPKYLPERRGARIALERLLTFFSNKVCSAENALCPQEDESLTDTEWAARVTHHLLSKLTVGPNYTLDNQCRGKIKNLICDCGCGEKLSGHYGDTSLGVPQCWHGRVDVLMDVAVRSILTEPDSPGLGNQSSVEMKSTSDRMVASREQIRAETIVFSFLQKKNYPELDNFLIPTIAMSRRQVAICLYDSQNDIFLETPLLDLFVGGRFLKEATIVTLWFALNFRYCCSGVPEEIFATNFKADFFKLVGPLVEKYSVDVCCPCEYKTTHRWLAVPHYEKIEKKVTKCK